MISIIVPVYKVEEYLGRCVDSLLQQSFGDLEVILVDDGSPDGCGAICDAYASQDPRVRAVHKSNGGLSSARNAGLHVATGDVIAFVDSDDWVAPDFLEAMYVAMQREGADIVECGVVKTSGEEETAAFAAGAAPAGGSHVASALSAAPDASSASAADPGSSAPSDSSTPVLTAFAPEPALRELIHDGIFHQTVWNKLYRREVLDGIPFAEGRLNEDEFWTYQVFARARKILRLDRPLYCYFQRPGSIMGASYSIRRLDALDAKTERQAFFEEHFPALAATARLNLAATCLFSAQMSLRYLSGDELRAAREKIDPIWARFRPSREDLAPLSFRNGLWLRLARLSFWGTARLKCILRKGF